MTNEQEEPNKSPEEYTIQDWEKDASYPEEYHDVKVERGQEYMFRLNTGADVWLATQQFAKDNYIRFARVHTIFHGGLQPARFYSFAPTGDDPEDWGNEEPVEIQNHSMVISIGGIIHPRPLEGGGEEPFPAVHFTIGGAWGVNTEGGHILPGTKVKGTVAFFITELKGIENLYPLAHRRGDPDAEAFPESWYKEVEK